MTLNTLQFGRKVLPFLISFCCVIPSLLLHSGGFSSIPFRYTLIAFSLATIVPFFYVVLKMREPRWNREMEEFVRAQIRRSLITLIPSDLNITDVEREQLSRTEIYKKLSGVFWDTINETDVLRMQKEQFYSNGLEYSTEIDVFLLSRFFGIFHLCLSVVLGDPALFFLGAALIAIGLVTRWFAIPRARQQHLVLSAEQLALLKKEKGEYVSGRFRDIVLAWRATQQPASIDPELPLRPRHLGLWDVLTVIFVLVMAAVGIFTRGWLGANASVKSDPVVSSAYISSGKHDRPVAVVFVHGVFGERTDTWLNTESKAEFPELLAADPTFGNKIDVFVFEYFTPKFSLAPSIVDLSDQLRGELDDHRVFDEHRAVVFLAHSMGGIIVRQFLLTNRERIQKVPMIFFYATPTNGSDLAALARIASANPQLRGMTPLEGNDFLQSIQSGWLNSLQVQAIASHCAVEELPMYGQIVVSRSSASSLCNRGLDPFSSNHIDIVKPQDRSDPRYSRFTSALVKEVPSLTLTNKAPISERATRTKSAPEQAPVQLHSNGDHNVITGVNNGTIQPDEDKPAKPERH
jgi:pimeloyl-ACP methyl ester carboxylesterase